MTGLMNAPFFFILSFLTSLSYAAPINVTKFTDSFDGICDSDCSLREAVVLANATPGRDDIALVAGTYTLNILAPVDIDYGLEEEDLNVNGDLDITDDITITGSITGTTIIDAANNDRAFDIISGSVSLKQLTITRGRQSYYGGAIENHGTLTLNNCIIKNNSSGGMFTPGIGGGIANWGSLKIYASTFANNYAGAGEGYRGQAGAIYNVGDLIVRDSTFRENGASDDDDSGRGAGIYNKGTADIRRSLFTQHYLTYMGFGAAIMNAGGSMKIVSSTISDNSPGENGKGAIANGSPYEAAGKLYLTNVTIVDNTNFGLYTNGYTYIRNSIISGNYRPEDGLAQNCYRESGLIDERESLMGDGDNPNCWTNYSFTNNKTFTTLLEPLADNGGPTLTHALRPGSAAIDRSEAEQCPMSDQRGEFTHTDGNGDGVAKCDLGAVEYHP